MYDYLKNTIAKLRRLRPDDKTLQPDRWDKFLSYKRIPPKSRALIKEIRESLYTSIPLTNTEYGDLKSCNPEELCEDDLFYAYLNSLRSYISSVNCYLGRHRYFFRKEKPIAFERPYHQLWNTELLKRFSADQMLLIHWLAVYRLEAKLSALPKLIGCFLKHPELVPLCFRQWYYRRFYEVAISCCSLPKRDKRPRYRDVPKGNFDFERYTKNGRDRLPDTILNAIKQDAVGITDIYLTTMNKTWSAGIFAMACAKNSWNIIRHYAQILPLQSGVFSAYDCILYVLDRKNWYYCRDYDTVLKIFEEERPGILKNYHDDYGNSLLRFAFYSYHNYFQENTVLKNLLVEAGCDPKEKNALKLSFEDFSCTSSICIIEA